MNYDELETRVLDSIENSNPHFEQRDFAMPAVIPSKSVIEMGVGGGLAGIVSNQIGGISQLSMITSVGINGLVPVLAGTVVKLVTKKTGLIENLSNGLIIGGIAEFVATLAAKQGLGVEQKREKQVENTQIVPKGMNAIW
tara:strand:- start:78 stop:497 length:420 start_codon:yes stop_codon:yes gene_type:complete